MKNQWYDFYKKRINSTYQDYFNQRYKLLLDLIENEKPSIILEEGVGIGSVSKGIKNLNCSKIGFDIDPKMLDLCEKNNPDMILYCDSIINPNVSFSPDLVVTHGVLEHFSDNIINIILNRYKRKGVKNIHYIPTSGYKTPSFGDERLLPYQYWLDKFKPKHYALINDDKDLILINI